MQFFSKSCNTGVVKYPMKPVSLSKRENKAIYTSGAGLLELDAMRDCGNSKSLSIYGLHKD